MFEVQKLSAGEEAYVKAIEMHCTAVEARSPTYERVTQANSFSAGPYLSLFQAFLAVCILALQAAQLLALWQAQATGTLWSVRGMKAHGKGNAIGRRIQTFAGVGTCVWWLQTVAPLLHSCCDCLAGHLHVCWMLVLQVVTPLNCAPQYV